MFCKNCGKQISGTEKFCPYCGSQNEIMPVMPVVPEANAVSAAPAVPFGQPVMYQPFIQAKKKTSLLPLIIILLFLTIATVVLFFLFDTKILGWILAAAALALTALMIAVFAKKGMLVSIVSLAVAAAVISVSFIFTTPFDNKPDNDENPGGSTVNSGDTGLKKESSVTSADTYEKDYGNIVNGQFYFYDGTYEYYSSFDPSGAAHIYKRTKGSSNAQTIFNGFGWSLVVKNDWLYFSGNQGTVIDGTYNLFRMKTDGTGLEYLNNTYSYGMNIYKSWIYYLKATDSYLTEFNICRCDLEGKNEEIIDTGAISSMFIYDNKMYYVKSNIIYAADTDGKNASALSNDTAVYMVLGNGKIVFSDYEGDIIVMDTDGSNANEILLDYEDEFGRLNAYNDKIYYVIYSTDFNSESYAYYYSIYSMNFDGSDKQKVYESYSYGFYFNLAGDKLYVLDYARDPENFYTFPAIAKSMSLTGENITVLPRDYTYSY